MWLGFELRLTAVTDYPDGVETEEDLGEWK